MTCASGPIKLVSLPSENSASLPRVKLTGFRKRSDVRATHVSPDLVADAIQPACCEIDETTQQQAIAPTRPNPRHSSPSSSITSMMPSTQSGIVSSRLVASSEKPSIL